METRSGRGWRYPILSGGCMGETQLVKGRQVVLICPPRKGFGPLLVKADGAGLLIPMATVAALTQPDRKKLSWQGYGYASRGVVC